MKYLVLLLPLVFVLSGCFKPSIPDLVVERKGVRLVLTSKPCENKVVLGLAEMLGLPSGMKDQLLAGHASVPKDGFEADLCYHMHMSRKSVFILDEKGNSGPFTIVEDVPENPLLKKL